MNINFVIRCYRTYQEITFFIFSPKLCHFITSLYSNPARTFPLHWTPFDLQQEQQQVGLSGRQEVFQSRLEIYQMSFSPRSSIILQVKSFARWIIMIFEWQWQGRLGWYWQHYYQPTNTLCLLLTLIITTSDICSKKEGIFAQISIKGVGGTRPSKW